MVMRKRATVKDNSRSDAQWIIPRGVLPSAPIAEESVLLVAMKIEGVRRPKRTPGRQDRGQASFALISDKPEMMEAGIELCGGRTTIAYQQGGG
jgi:hypothetical protein